MNVENSSLRGFDWGCVWHRWQRTLLLFSVRLCPALGQFHFAEGCTMRSWDAPFAGDSLSGWQCLLLDYVSSCFDMTQLKICSMCSSHSLSLPAVALFFSSKDLFADVWSLTLFEPETLCKSLTKSSPLSLQALLTDTRCFTCLTLNTHVLTADGWVGIFMYSKSAWSHRLARSVNQKILRGPFCALTESVKTCVCLHPFIIAWYVQKCCCSSLTLSSVKGQNLHAVFAAAFLGLPG